MGIRQWLKDRKTHDDMAANIVLNQLVMNGPMTAKQLVMVSGFRRFTVHRGLVTLNAEGLIEGETEKNGYTWYIVGSRTEETVMSPPLGPPFKD